MKIDHLNTGIQLLPEKAVFLTGEQTLIVADLHFGKINHFRMAGLPVPAAANQRNAEALIDLVNKMMPVRTIFLGDLFHSHYNDEWEVVGQIVRHFPACRFELVRGNHDIMSEQQYVRKGIVVKDLDEVGPWILTHEPLDGDAIPHGKVNLAGHLHPGARLQGRGRQSLTLPCFWISPNRIVLPAFGSFTGLAIITPDKDDEVHVILESKIIKVVLEPTGSAAG